MSRTLLKYVYLVLGTGLATLTTLAAYSGAQERADPDDDGENERNAAAVRRREERQLRRRGEARSPMEAATYRADELVQRPLRTLLLVVGYEVLFVGVAVCVAYTDRVTGVLGPDLGEVAALVALLLESVLPASLVPLLPAASVGLGLVFALVVHQSVRTAGDIRRATAR